MISDNEWKTEVHCWVAGLQGNSPAILMWWRSLKESLHTPEWSHTHVHGCLISWHGNSHVSWIKWRATGRQVGRCGAADHHLHTDQTLTLSEEQTSRAWPWKANMISLGMNTHTVCACVCHPMTRLFIWHIWTQRLKRFDKKKKIYIYTVYNSMYKMYKLLSPIKAFRQLHYFNIPCYLYKGQRKG